MFEKIPRPPSSFNEKKVEKLDPHVERYLERIDFNRLRGVFSQKIESLGLDPEKNMPYFVSEKKHFHHSNFFGRRKRQGGYRPADETIEINPEDFQRQYSSPEDSENNDRVDINKANLLLARVCHEETHATSFQELQKEEIHWWEGGVKIQVGFEQTVAEVKLPFTWRTSSLFKGLNEGITDEIAEEVFHSYREGKERVFYESSYAAEINLLNDLLKGISKECGVDKEILWKVLQRGYFGGEDLDGEKMERLFKNVFPHEFKEFIKGFKPVNSEGLGRFATFWKQITWTEDDRKRIRRWILSVYRLMPKEASDSSASEKL